MYAIITVPREVWESWEILVTDANGSPLPYDVRRNPAGRCYRLRGMQADGASTYCIPDPQEPMPRADVNGVIGYEPPASSEPDPRTPCGKVRHILNRAAEKPGIVISSPVREWIIVELLMADLL